MGAKGEVHKPRVRFEDSPESYSYSSGDKVIPEKLEAAADFNRPERSTKQHIAPDSKKGRMKIEAFLEKHGFNGDVNSITSFLFKFRYPLHVAVKEKDVDMVRLLLSAGADKSLKNSSGSTPVEKAWKYFKQEKDEVARLVKGMILLELGEQANI